MFNNIFPKNFRKSLKIREWTTNICEDEVIGFLYKENTTTVFRRRADYTENFLSPLHINQYCNDKGIKVNGHISIILESPHIEEFFKYKLKIYNKSGYLSSRPANGNTGRNIDKYLVDIFKEIFINELNDGIYSIILVNSIQQQCSLGVNTLYYRDRIWTYSWYMKNINTLKTRLERIKPIIILNCSTQGEHYRMNKSHNGYDLGQRPLKMSRAFIKNEFKYRFILDNITSNSCISIRELISSSIIIFFPEIKIYNSTHPSSWWSKKNRILLK